MHLAMTEAAEPGSSRSAMPQPPAPLHRGEVSLVPLAQIDVDDTTFRFRLSLRVDLLAKSVREQGIQIPLVLRPGRCLEKPYQVVCGFRRAEAARVAGLQAVPAMIRVLSDVQAYELSFAENEFRKTLSDLDRANAIAQLMRAGRTVPEVAGMFRLSDRQVQRLRSLLEFPEALRRALEDPESGVLTTHAVVLMKAKRRHGDKVDLVEWLKDIELDRPSVSELQAMLRDELEDRSSACLIRCSGDRVAFNLRAFREAPREDRIVAMKRIENLLEEFSW